MARPLNEIVEAGWARALEPVATPPPVQGGEGAPPQQVDSMWRLGESYIRRGKRFRAELRRIA